MNLPPSLPPHVPGIGLDLIEISRIQSAHRRHGEAFLHRIFTEEEIAYCLAIRNPYPSLAARFAAKEAIAKALGTGISSRFGWKSASVHHHPGGAPGVRLDHATTQLLASLNARSVRLSLTHTSTTASAVAILQQ
ncbi:MAG: holo-ACP synthase [Puniceicoccaceae bacterium]